MKRRSFLGMLGLGGVAASVSQGVEVAPSYDSPYVIGSGGPIAVDYKQNLINAKNRLLFMTGTKEEWIATRIANMRTDPYANIPPIPPDIAALKSFSGIAKYNLHLRRLAENQHKSMLKDVMEQIEHYTMKGKG